MAVRERLDRRTWQGRKYTAMQSFTYEGRKYIKGDPFSIDALSWHNVQTLHGGRHIDLLPIEQEPEPEGEDRGVTLTSKGGGNYEITAAWLDPPVKVRGKDAAEAEAERIRTEGAPLGFIAGGSDVTIEDVGGGWYAVTAPWLEMPVKVQGRDLAGERQREIHAAGEPAEHHGVTLTEVGNGWYDVKADWEPETEKVQGQEAARARAAELRTAGPPKPGDDEPAPFKVGDVVLVGPDGGALAGLRAVIKKIDGENAEVVGFNTNDPSDGTLKSGTFPLASLTLATKE